MASLSQKNWLFPMTLRFLPVYPGTFFLTQRLLSFPKVFDHGPCVKPFGNQLDNSCAILITFSFPFTFKLIEYALLLFGIQFYFSI